MSYLSIFLIPTIFAGFSYASYRFSMWSVLTRLQETKTKLLESGISNESELIVEINNQIEKIKCFKADKKMFNKLYDISHKGD